MKFISIKRVEVSTNGATSFSFGNLTGSKHVIFYEKDLKSVQFFVRHNTHKLPQKSFYSSYKLKYTF